MVQRLCLIINDPSSSAERCQCVGPLTKHSQLIETLAPQTLFVRRCMPFQLSTKEALLEAQYLPYNAICIHFQTKVE